MPAVKLSPLFNDQTVMSTGTPASGYKVYTYAAGSSTLLATYTDSNGSVAQTNPVVLNSSGYPTNGPIWLQTGLSYKLVLTDASGNVIRTIDNVTGINDSSSSTSQWLSSGVTPTYVSASSFTLPGDQTTDFHVGRALQFTTTAGTVYGRISVSAYTTLTTVAVVMDSGQSLDSGLSGVNVSILRADHNALPVAPIGQQVFSSSGTFTVPAGVNKVYVTAAGGGGGGAAYNGATSGGSGGGAGGSCIEMPVSVTPGASIAVTIGAAGAGGASASAPGTAGGTTSLGALLSCTGGAGGVTASTGGVGGTVSGGDASGLRVAGQIGERYNPYGTHEGGEGGSSLLGKGGRGGKNAGSTPAEAGVGFGAGGGGGCSNIGAAGSPGILIIRW